MSKWIATLALGTLMACTPNTGPGFTYGNGDDDDTAEDSGLDTTSDCPPTLGAVEAAIDDYPGKGWVAEVTIPFTDGSCDVGDGQLYLSHPDGSGGTATEGPFEIGVDGPDVWIENYDEHAGTGELFFAMLVEGYGEPIDFTLWPTFPDGSQSNEVSGTAS